MCTHTLVIEWLTHLAQETKLSGSTIEHYKVGLSTRFIESDLLRGVVRDSPCNHPAVEKLMIGIKKIHAARDYNSRKGKEADPLTLSHLQRIYTLSPPLTPPDIMIFCACILMVSGVMRIGEAFGERAWTLSQLTFNQVNGQDHMSVFLPISKTDQLRQGRTVSIALPLANHMARQWYRIRTALPSAASTPLPPDAPLFQILDRPLTRERMLERCREWLILIGEGDLRLQGRSFRKGGASSLAAAGVPMAAIKETGRWVGHSVGRYINQAATDQRNSDIIKHMK